MHTPLPIVLTAALVSVAANAPAQTAVTDDVRSRWEASCMIRHDKFDYVLPGAMRRNDIDMWIVIDRGRGTQPMTRDFAVDTVNGQGFFIFTDRGGERIERRQLGGETDLAQECGAYDRFGETDELRAIVEERDPGRIGLNYLAVPYESEGLHIADGLTHTQTSSSCTSELGEKYAARFVSAQHLIADFHGERVAGEIIEFSKVGDLTRRLIERALSNEVITPGVTTHNDVARWLEEHLKTEGLLRAWYPTVYTHLPDGNEIGGTERVIQRGDVLQIDWGADRNNFTTDIKRFAYVLREGETAPPPGVLNAFAETKKVQEIIRKHVRPGRTGREQLDELKQLIRDAGYVYTEAEAISDVPGIEVNVGMHAAGNIGHDMAASLFEIFPERTKYVVRPNSIISLEYIVFTPAEEWNGNKIPVNVEENVLITERGIEWLYPPQARVLVIR